MIESLKEEAVLTKKFAYLLLQAILLIVATVWETKPVGIIGLRVCLALEAWIFFEAAKRIFVGMKSQNDFISAISSLAAYGLGFGVVIWVMTLIVSLGQLISWNVAGTLILGSAGITVLLALSEEVSISNFRTIYYWCVSRDILWNLPMPLAWGKSLWLRIFKPWLMRHSTDIIVLLILAISIGALLLLILLVGPIIFKK